MTDELNFSLVRKEKEVAIEGERYVLVELDGFGRDKYLNNLGNRVRITKEGHTAGIKNFDGMEASLVAECLKKIDADGTRKDVSMAVIQKWPSRVISALHDAAKELSLLEASKKEDGDDGEEEEKND